MITIEGKKYLVEKEMAEKYGLTIHWFRKVRYRGDSPPYYKLGGKIYYTENDVDEWFRKNLKCFTKKTTYHIKE